MKTLTFDRNIAEGTTIYSPGFLETMPTIHSGHFDDLKLQTNGLRYWLSRVTEDDPEGWVVCVEKSNGRGGWEITLRYR